MDEKIKQLHENYRKSIDSFYENETVNNKRKMNSCANELRKECEINNLSFLKVCDELTNHILKIN